MWDVWFGRDANYSNTQSTPNDSYSSIDRDDSPQDISTMTLALLEQLLLDDIFVDGPGLNVLI